jgi:hypothetical protein
MFTRRPSDHKHEKITVITKEMDKTTWQKVMEPVIQEWNKSFGKDKINAIINGK